MATGIIGPGGLTGANAQASLQQTRESQFLNQMSSFNVKSDDAKIDKSAQQFEAILLTNWLKEAEASFATIPGAEDDEDAANRDQMMGLGVQSLAESMAATGGIGIAKMISKALHAAAENAAPPAENQPSSGQIDGKS